MQKRIFSEKINYYSNLLKESSRQNLSYISNFDNTIFNFTASSLINKSVFNNINEENSISKIKMIDNEVKFIFKQKGYSK